MTREKRACQPEQTRKKNAESLQGVHSQRCQTEAAEVLWAYAAPFHHRRHRLPQVLRVLECGLQAHALSRKGGGDPRVQNNPQRDESEALVSRVRETSPGRK